MVRIIEVACLKSHFSKQRLNKTPETQHALYPREGGLMGKILNQMPLVFTVQTCWIHDFELSIRDIQYIEGL